MDGAEVTGAMLFVLWNIFNAIILLRISRFFGKATAVYGKNKYNSIYVDACKSIIEYKHEVDSKYEEMMEAK